MPSLRLSYIYVHPFILTSAAPAKGAAPTNQVERNYAPALLCLGDHVSAMSILSQGEWKWGANLFYTSSLSPPKRSKGKRSLTCGGNFFQRRVGNHASGAAEPHSVLIGVLTARL